MTGDLAAAIDAERIARIAAELVALRAECRALAIVPTADGCVKAREAARLVNLTPKTLTNWRLASSTLPKHKRLAGHSVGSRVFYRLTELAEWRVNNTAE